MEQKTSKTPPINKGTSGEIFVSTLASKAYLKYWCYPNPVDLDGDKKEICDLLILFFDTLIIISVKNYDTKGDYKRYRKKVMYKSTNQLLGAERKLFKSTHAIKIRHPEKGIVTFEPKEYKLIFRITVSLGSDINEYEFIDSQDGKVLVNVLNKETFSSIIDELDTIKDLVEYLKQRELILCDNIGKIAKCSEKDLLAYYMLNKREFPKAFRTDFEVETFKIKNNWQVYLKNKSVLLKKLADENSYFIDELIEKDILRVKDGELLAAELMTLSRFERRIIANNLFEIVHRYQDEKDFFARRFGKYKNVGFLFIYYPIERTQEEIDIILQNALQLYSYFHKTDKVVLLAAAKNLLQWKFGLYQASPLSQKQKEYLKKLAEEYGWFKNEMRIEKNVKEYPDE